jgi:hypothetical protein
MVSGTTRSTHAPNLLSDQVVSDRALSGGFVSSTRYFDQTGKLVGAVSTTDVIAEPCLGKFDYGKVIECSFEMCAGWSRIGTADLVLGSGRSRPDASPVQKSPPDVAQHFEEPLELGAPPHFLGVLEILQDVNQQQRHVEPERNACSD